MGLQKIFSRRDLDINDTDYLEVNVTDVDSALAGSISGKIGVKIEKLTDFGDTERVLKSIREGHIVFLKIKGLKERDIGELKRAVERLKKALTAQNVDIVGVEQDWLLLVPHFAAVHK